MAGAKRAPWMRRPWVWGVVCAVLVGSWVVWSKHQAQPVYVVNGTGAPVAVVFPGGPELEVPARSTAEVWVPQGVYEVELEGERLSERVEAEVVLSWGDWLGLAPTYVINPGGAAMLWIETEVVSADPAQEVPEVAGGLKFGASFERFEGVHYPFAPFPATMKAEPGRTVQRRRLDALLAPPRQVLTAFPEESPLEAKLTFAELHLELSPEDQDLLEAYRSLALKHGEGERLRGVLQAGLSINPVAVGWHRMYQDLERQRGQGSALLKTYDELLEGSPKDPALLYLRGRIESEPDRALRFYERATDEDPNFGFAWHAKAYHRAARGEFEAAEACCARVRGRPDRSMEMRALDHRVRLACGQAEALLEDLEGLRTREPLDPNVQRWWLEALVVSGDEAGAQGAHETYAQSVEAAGVDDLHGLVPLSACSLADALDDAEALEVAAEELPGGQTKALYMAQALLERGELEAAEALFAGGGLGGSARSWVLLGLARHRAEVPTWREAFERAAAIYLAQGGRTSAFAGWLLAPEAPAVGDVRKLSADVLEKAVVVTALSVAFPEDAELRGLARRLNVGVIGPQRLLAEALSED